MGQVEELRPDVAELDIPVGAVSRLAQCGPAGRWDEAVGRAIERARGLAEPAVWRVELDDGELAGLFPGDPPVAPIIARCPRWAFLATIGSRLEEAVQTLGRDGDFLDSVLLDAAGSVAVDGLCDLAERSTGELPFSNRFSPGYCGWSLEAQTGLFARLRPGDQRVCLLPSRLMRPLKSASGIIVRARTDDLRVPSSACEQCRAVGCGRRRGRRPEPFRPIDP